MAEKGPQDALFPLLGSFFTGVSMIVGIWVRDALARKRRETDAELSSAKERRAQQEQLKKEREDYKDKWTATEMQRLLLENEVKHLTAENQRLQNELDDRRRRPLA